MMKEKHKHLLVIALIALIALVLLLAFKFKFSKKEPSKYMPGNYMSAITLNNQTVYMNVTVDDKRIIDISLDIMDETAAAMYPLMQPALDNISQQIYEKQSLDDITYEKANQYTSVVLLNAIEEALSKAQVHPE